MINLQRSFLKWFVILSLGLGWISLLPCCGKGKMEPIQTPTSDFTLKTLNDQEITLSKLKGKVVLLDFWATWCGPCRESIPHLIQLYKTYQEKGVEVIGMSMDKGDIDQVRRFVKSMDIPYAIIIASDEVVKNYRVTGLPTTILIDKSGKIQGKIVGFNTTIANQINTKVKDLILENP